MCYIMCIVLKQVYFRKDADIMSTIKPIQATPELSGKDAVAVLKQVSSTPSAKAVKKNKMLYSVLEKVRKS